MFDPNRIEHWRAYTSIHYQDSLLDLVYAYLTSGEVLAYDEPERVWALADHVLNLQTNAQTNRVQGLAIAKGDGRYKGQYVLIPNPQQDRYLHVNWRVVAMRVDNVGYADGRFNRAASEWQYYSQDRNSALAAGAVLKTALENYDQESNDDHL